MNKKAKLKLLGRVRDARQRMRDRAAGEHTVAEAAELAASERREEAEAEIDGVKDAALAKLSEARDVRTLWHLEHEHALAIDNLKDAEKAAQAAKTEAERTRLRLIARARELKTAEKVIDKTRGALRRSENRAEQRSNDELASRTRGGE